MEWQPILLVVCALVGACGDNRSKKDDAPHLREAVNSKTGERFIYSTDQGQVPVVTIGGCPTIKDVNGWKHEVCSGDWKNRKLPTPKGTPNGMATD